MRTHVELGWQRRAWADELELRVKQRTAQLEAQIQWINLLDEITRAIAGRQDLRSIFQLVIRHVQEQLPVDACWIGPPDSEALGAALGGELLYEPDIGNTDTAMSVPPELSALGLRALVVAPLKAEGALLGALLAARREPDSFSAGECDFLRKLSERVATAVLQGHSGESLQSAYQNLHLSQPSDATVAQDEAHVKSRR